LPGRSREGAGGSARLLWAGAAGGSVALAAYISFVPFDFRLPDAGHLAANLSAALTLSIESRANFLANIVLFVPVGFFGTGALGIANPLAARLRVVLLLAAMVAASTAIEATQLLLPGRTPAGSDVFAQLMGGVVGIALWAYVGRELETWWDDRRSEGSRPALRLLQAGVALLTLLALLPLDVSFSASTLAEKFRGGRIVVAPFSQRSGGLTPTLIADLLFSMPFGALAFLVRGRSRSRRQVGTALLMATAAIVSIELCQVFIISRTADVTDVLIGIGGAALGILLAGQLVGATPGEREVERGSLWPAAGLVASLVAYALMNLSPFDFVLMPAMIRERWPMLWQVPFYTYYVNPELQAFETLVGKIMVSLPIGICANLVLSRARGPFSRLRLATILFMLTIFLVGVEMGQMFLPSRFPDMSDVILGLMGVGMGFKLARLGIDDALTVGNAVRGQR
jgi:VanZ family protein